MALQQYQEGLFPDVGGDVRIFAVPPDIAGLLLIGLPLDAEAPFLVGYDQSGEIFYAFLPKTEKFVEELALYSIPDDDFLVTKPCNSTRTVCCGHRKSNSHDPICTYLRDKDTNGQLVWRRIAKSCICN